LRLNFLCFIGIIFLIINFFFGEDLAKKLKDKRKRQEAIQKGKRIYIDSRLRVRDTATDCVLYRLLLHTGKYDGEYYCYNADCFHPQVHSKIGTATYLQLTR
jgi:hypothetical protein